MIRTTKHSNKFANTNKLNNYDSFITEMRRVAATFVNYMWNTKYEYHDKNNKLRIMDIQNQQYDIPPFFDYNLIQVETTLSTRALSSLVTQCCGMVKACTEKQQRRLHMFNQKKQNGETIHPKLIENIQNGIPTKPNTERMNIEISSKNSDFQLCHDQHFDAFLRIKYFGMTKEDIKVPILFTKQSNKWMKKAQEVKHSFLLCNDNIQIRWQYDIKEKTEGKVVGADTGKNKIMTLGDSQTTPKEDKHQYSMDTIMNKMARKKYGSKNFKQTQVQRNNFINWSLNQLELSKIKEVRLEKVVNICFGKNVSRKMKRWTNAHISKRFKELCEENGVRVSEQSSAFRSQRCSCCGIVLKKNRKGENYNCVNCGFEIDSDFNATKNHEVDLPEVPAFVSDLHLNKTEGFYWKPEGFFGVGGEELRVSHSNINV